MLKVVLVLGVIVLASWLAFGFGANSGSRSAEEVVDSFQQRFSGMFTTSLEPADLAAVRAGCAVLQADIVVPRGVECIFSVRGGGMRARRADVALAAGSGTARVTLAPSNQTRPKDMATATVAPDSAAPVAFYAEGGELVLSCTAPGQGEACRFRLRPSR